MESIDFAEIETYQVDGLTKPIKKRVAKKPRVKKSCSSCKSSHLSCDQERPCTRCISRGISDSCSDIVQKKRGRKPTKLSPGESPASSFDFPDIYREIDSNDLALALNSDYSRESYLNELLDLPNSLLLEIDAAPITPESIMRQSPSLRYLLEGKPLKNETPSNTLRLEWMVDFLDIIKDWSQETFDFYSNCIVHYNQMEKARAELTQEMVITILKDFDDTITQYKNTFENMTIPTIVYDQSDVVHYYNKAYSDLTGFTAPYPTERKNYAMSMQYSKESFIKNIAVCSAIYTKGESNVTSISEIKSYGGLIKCMEYISIKRDLKGLPLLLVSNFIPLPPIGPMMKEALELSSQKFICKD